MLGDTGLWMHHSIVKGQFTYFTEYSHKGIIIEVCNFSQKKHQAHAWCKG